MNSGLLSWESRAMLKYIEEKSGISIGEDKIYLMESRLSGLLAESGFKSFEELYQKIISGDDAEVAEKVVDAVTTNETFWFRDRTPWYILEDIILPVFIRELREGKRNKARIWSAACSSGQEPYSVAMCIDNYLVRNEIRDISLLQFEIVATDISGSMIRVATVGRFDGISITRGLDNEYRDRYFEYKEKAWNIAGRIKNSVRFQKLNLQGDFSHLGMFDVVFCRNVLIYFVEKTKQEVLGKVTAALNRGGVMFLGSSELFPGKASRFEIGHHRGGIYYKLKE